MLRLTEIHNEVMNLTEKRSGRSALFFMFICAAIYFTSYVTRKNYAAVLIEIEKMPGIDRAATGLVSTAAALTYGFGQVISGLLGDRFKPRTLILAGIAMTTVCNTAMPLAAGLTGGIAFMVVLWGVNGFAQALFWPPLVRLLYEQLSESDYNRACIWVSTGGSVATIFLYLAAPVFVTVADWRALFWFGAGVGVAMFVIWFFVSRGFSSDEAPTVKNKESESSSDAEKKQPIPYKTLLISSCLIPIALCIILQGVLRDGLMDWMPTFISESFDLPSASSILSGVILPIFSIFSYKVAEWIQKKVVSELLTCAILFGTSTVSALLMMVFYGGSAIVTILLFAIVSGCMHGINLMLTTRVPRYFAKYGIVSTASGLLNSFTYIGSAISGWGFAVLSQNFGWYITILSWVMVAGAGLVISLVILKPWQRFSRG